jgi:hypothetical protein
VGRRNMGFRRWIFAGIATGAGLVFLEGLCSVLLVAMHVYTASPPAGERIHTRYDPDLGWTSKPNVELKHVYGPGRSIRTNSQGFRDDQDFGVNVPPGKVRVVCSGDSFTFGHGVDNRDTWCQLLAASDPRLETVNMGQGAYGFDQAYLWYMRDGTRLQHDVQVFAFITDDVERMRRDEFEGWGKPVLRVKDGALVVDNVPVPKRGELAAWLREKLAPLRELRTFEALRAVATSLVPSSLAARRGLAQSDAETREALAKVLESLQQANAAKGSRLVVVHLPVKWECAPEAEPSEWTESVKADCAERGIPFLDLVEDFRSLPQEQLAKMFLVPTGGHYSRRGNRRVAEIVVRSLASDPQVAARLAKARS